MNTILQQRIEEAAQQCATTTDGKIISFAYLAAKQMADWLLQNQWISVEEALPEEHGVYFVLINSKVPRIITFTDKWNIGNNTYNITHWMPIPKLKEEE